MSLVKVKYIIILLFVFIIIGCTNNKKEIEKKYGFVSSSGTKAILYDSDMKEVSSVTRGMKVELISEDGEYYKIKYDSSDYLISRNNISLNDKDLVKEKELFVRTNLNVYKDSDSSNLIGMLKKGSSIEILGYDKLNDDGTVNKYKIKYKDGQGYVRSKYLVNTKEESLEKYNYNNSLDVLSKMGSSLGGGNALSLDYYPYKKGDFKDNVMPNEVRALYINSSEISKVDEYIKLAKESNINSFVVDIKENTAPAYPAHAMEKYSKTSYERAINEYDDYKEYIKKLKDNGFYVIGRITVFKDSYFVEDNISLAIKNNETKEPLEHNDSYWPSAYQRKVWEYNVELAKESAKEMGFNEIQFDYVRFPDRTMNLEVNNKIDMINDYDETKSEAIQLFVIYATDELHELDTYVAIDVFGESAHNYVTAYGQFLPAISNIADVVCPMPYPDHFDIHQYGIQDVVWQNPYKLMNTWGSYVEEKQKLIETPAKVRTWIQAYDVRKTPSVVYDSNKVSEQIDGLYSRGLTSGYMAWNSSSSISKYNEIKEAFMKERVNND